MTTLTRDRRAVKPSRTRRPFAEGLEPLPAPTGLACPRTGRPLFALPSGGLTTDRALAARLARPVPAEPTPAPMPEPVRDRCVRFADFPSALGQHLAHALGLLGYHPDAVAVAVARVEAGADPAEVLAIDDADVAAARAIVADHACDGLSDDQWHALAVLGAPDARDFWVEGEPRGCRR